MDVHHSSHHPWLDARNQAKDNHIKHQTYPTQAQPPYLKPTSQSTNTKTPTNSKNPTRFQLQNLHQGTNVAHTGRLNCRIH